MMTPGPETASSSEARALLHGLFLEIASRAPERTAVIADDLTLTYGDLDRRSRLVAATLLRAGLRAGDTLAIVLEKGWEQIVGALAALRAGATFVPIDASAPRARMARLVGLAQARILLTRLGLRSDGEWPAAVEVIDIDSPQPEDLDHDSALPAVDSRMPAYIFFTSGSTGVPKGVWCDHLGPSNTLRDLVDRFGVGEDDRVLALSSFSFDLSVFDIFATLMTGACIVMPRPSAYPDPGRWLDLVRSSRVTIWNSVPAFMEIAISHLEVLGGIPSEHLRLVLLSGDWIPTSLPSRIRRFFPNARIVSLGGATEVSVWSIAHEIEQVDPSWTSIPYGRALRGQSFDVYDDELEDCPVGQRGELYISGAGLALGYYGDRARTAASFIPHPTSGGRMYRTGDLGRWMPNGEIEFLGRIDKQIKLRGYRVELGEIEAALLSLDDVRHAVTLLTASETGDRIVAYVVFHESGTRSDCGDLRRRLGELLPSYMIPSEIFVLAAMPLTPNGKVDRAALALMSETSVDDLTALLGEIESS